MASSTSLSDLAAKSCKMDKHALRRLCDLPNLINRLIKNLDIKLADLESRLNTVLPLEIMNPADEEKMNLINFELQQRGLEINDKEMQYIFTHHSRDLNSLLNLAEKLDEISHQEKKSISINLIKKII